MASAVKAKLQRLTNPGGQDGQWKAEAERYKIYVTAGPSYDKSQHKQVYVNTNTPVVVENEFMKVKIKVRIRQYHGLPTTAPSHNQYFDHPLHEKDQYSIAFSFVPKQDLPCQDTVWGNDFDHPIRERLPPGFNTAFRIVKEFIDPGLACDAYADEPWLYGPSLSSWFAFVIGGKVDLDTGEDFPAPTDESPMIDGAEGDGAAVRQEFGLPETGDRRRKHFLSAANREAFVFEKNRLYAADFFNPYISFGEFALKLPGFSLKVIKYVDQKSHCLRYVFKNRKTGDVYFNVNFNLFWGQELEQALKEDEQERERERQASVGAEEDQASAGAAQVNGHAENGAPREPNAPTQSSTDPPQIGAGAETETIGNDKAPPTMQLHPGDHSATAEAASSGPIMSEITKMLQATSTSDGTGTKLNIWRR